MNTYDQVIRQVGMNIQSSAILPERFSENSEPSRESSVFDLPEGGRTVGILHSQTQQHFRNMNEVGDQVQHRNYAQEEKDEEMLKNISNYSNLLEQQLFVGNALSTASTPSSRILMANLSNETDGVKGFLRSKKIDDSCAPQPNQPLKICKNLSQKSLLGGRVLSYKGKEN